MLSAVISKMSIRGTLFFGTGAVTQLGCICENDLMAAYATSDEDKLFTKYSPWGEMRLGHAFTNSPLETKTFYCVALPPESKVLCAGAAHVHYFRVESVTDYGSSKSVRCKADALGDHQHSSIDQKAQGELDWKMTIDNPPAVEFFVPGRSGYRVAFYDAAKFTKDTALADALGR